MSHKLQNILTLLIVTLILSGIGSYFLFRKYPKMVNKIEMQINEYDKSVQQIPEKEDYLKSVYQVIEKKKNKLASLDKVIEPDISLANAFNYLDKIQDRFGPLNFDLAFDKNVQGANFGYRVFKLSGESTFEAIYSLIWTLERGPKVFSIENLMLRGVQNNNLEEDQPFIIIPFDMQVRAMYAKIKDFNYDPGSTDDQNMQNAPMRSAHPEIQNLSNIVRVVNNVSVPPAGNLFWPLIVNDLPPNIDDLLEAERSELRAILPDKAVIADHEGDLHILETGDEVYLGYLTKIDQENNWVEFTLDKGGIIEEFILIMPFITEEE
ncbi:MAG: hypothetical protein P9L92_20830 [Candidatus Electryonea clarkiae]|nr:hypothetical protein [Candidatus Electryonea clarkiae]MDP8288522.1 hypothetical protein [Candidatus Electryonea clarkiae]